MKNLNFDEIREAIRQSSKETAIYIGADSQRYSDRSKSHKMVAYVVAIVLHYDGCRGAKVFRELHLEPDYTNSLRQRLMTEVGHISRVASEIVDHIDGRPFEIHLDVNPDPRHKSNIVIKEAIGWIKGQFGIEPKVKPDAVASSTIADRYAVKGARGNERKNRKGTKKKNKSLSRAS